MRARTREREREREREYKIISTSTFLFAPRILSVHIFRIRARRPSATGFPTGSVQ
jgi:hypothetical protein